jgi:aryl-alcohol dehydrogenase-like predicted oxidoreductase
VKAAHYFQEVAMEKRRLGRTGHESTVMIFGGAALWNETPETALPAIKLVREHGVNHFDVAPQYTNSERLVGPWLADHRDEVFLGCKTLERTRQAAWDELQRSLKTLQTDVIDLYQFHSVGDHATLDSVLGPGGAIEAFVEARDKGLIRYIGITGHGYESPAVHAEALERFDFDTVMTPLNFVEYADPHYKARFDHLLDLAQSRDVGLIIIKAFSRGPWIDGKKTYNTWYEPFDEQAIMQEAVNFVLSYPVTAFTHPGDLRLLPASVAAAENFRRLDAAEQAALIESAEQFMPLFER